MVKKISVSTKYMSRYAGKWVVIDPAKDVIIAFSKNLKDIEPFITRSANDKKLTNKMPAAFKVPRKDEGPYILVL